MFAQAIPTTQLGFLVDASGSIGAANFTTMRSGYAAALAALPTDGSIEVTRFSFAFGAVPVVAPTVITPASLPTVLTQINAMVYTTGQTYTHTGLKAISDAMIGSANYSQGLNSLINLATDGAPNPSAQGPMAIALAASLKSNGLIDSLTAEAIGPNPGLSFLQNVVFSPIAGPCLNCGVVLADGVTPPNPLTSAPWVLTVNSFDDFPKAISAKVQVLVDSTLPEPASLVLFCLGLAGLAFSRRRV